MGFHLVNRMNAFGYSSDQDDYRDEEVLEELLRIEPNFNYPESTADGFQYYLRSAESLVRRIMSKEIITKASSISSIRQTKEVEAFYESILNTVPCSTWSLSDSPPYTLSAIFLAPCEFTQGVGRFMCDVFSHWLIPGKQLPLVCGHSMAFSFKHCPSEKFFIQELFADVENPKDLSIVLSHLPMVTQELKLNVLAVQHARKVISARTLTLEQKKLVIQENIAALLGRQLEDCDNNVYDQFHNFFIKVLAEDKITQIKEQIAPLLEFRPQVFERNIFHDLQHFVFILKDNFSAIRSLKHLTRIISYSYIFRKMTAQAEISYPNQRQIHIKLLRTTLQHETSSQKVLGLLISINQLCDNEIFEERHIIKSVQTILPCAKHVAFSSLVDKRMSSKTRIFYLEFNKDNNTFTPQELHLLREKLQRELSMSIESIINPIFMPRNEEEIMKNIVTLNNQLKYINDLPQVIISFQRQTDTKICFTVILVRILRPETPSTKDLLSNQVIDNVRFSEVETKKIGLLRKKYSKEANILEVEIDKQAFLRNDFSVDLYEARKVVFNHLCKLYGELRDYNGGMISKQIEALSELKRNLLQIEVQNDFLVENFFYSLSPKYMQTILDSTVLKKLFILILEAIEHNYREEIIFLKTQTLENHFLLTVGATNTTIKGFLEKKIETLQLTPSALTTSYLNIYDISCVSYILKFQDPEEHLSFSKTILENIKIWKDTITQSLPSDQLPALILN